MQMRIKVAAAALCGILFLPGHGSAAAPSEEIHYSCDGAQHMVVRTSARGAIVQFVDRSYALKKARSSIGKKFLSPTAALIIDGRSAVFVAEDRLQLGECLEVRRTASAR